MDNWTIKELPLQDENKYFKLERVLDAATLSKLQAVYTKYWVDLLKLVEAKDVNGLLSAGLAVDFSKDEIMKVTFIDMDERLGWWCNTWELLVELCKIQIAKHSRSKNIYDLISEVESAGKSGR
jgi:hypothetical protein